MAIRDLCGYGGRPPHPHWPGGARVAVQFVLNVEEGAESTVVNGDSQSEAYLHELWGRPARRGARDVSVESLYEYGARAGFWRLLSLFNRRRIPLTVFATGLALALNPAAARAIVEAGHELAGHGWRWLDYSAVEEDVERQHIARTIDLIQRLSGKPPAGWYTGRVSNNSARLIAERDELLYTSDAYNDDLPYWRHDEPSPLVIPYTLVNNDCRFLQPNGFASGDDFYRHLRDCFDFLWREGEHCPKLMTVGLHGRICGHPARAMGLSRFLDYLCAQPDVWLCRRDQVAHHWLQQHPPPSP